MTSTDGLTQVHELSSKLAAILGREAVLDGEEDRLFYSQDIYKTADEKAALAIRPGTVEQLAEAVGAITGAGFSVTARGGGTSYTSGYLPERAQSVVVDTQLLNRVVTIDTKNMFVTCEAGITWMELYEALEPHGVRTPFWGPFSGRNATVGGSVSQNAVAWGATKYGVSAESVVGLEIVLADGTILPTGGPAIGRPEPFFRYYGPDLTGLFLGDTGALGIKARVTLRLIPAPKAVNYASFAFESHVPMAEAMAEVTRSALASECFGMCPVLQVQRMKRESLLKDVDSLKGVFTSGRGVLGGIKEAAKVVAAGRHFLKDQGYTMHVVTEGRSEREADEPLERIRQIATVLGGKEISNSIPKIMRSNPFFITLTSAIGPRGERWAPVHGILPLARAAEAWTALYEMFAEYEERIAEQGITVGYLLATVSTNGFVLEPVLYWPGRRPLFYDRQLDPAFLKKLDDFGDHPEAAALVEELRGRLKTLYLELGATHFQIGKTYLYKEGCNEKAYALVRAFKQTVDPDGLMNPGALSLP